jgi:hypothetical protein
MATQAQILANRRNSEKSTGPKTAEGKAAVAKNATKHGLFAQDNVVISENQAEFDAFRNEMLAELAPVGVMESILAERMVSLTWRLKRAERMQNEVIDAKIRREINGMAPKLSKSLLTGEPCDVSKYSKDCYDDLALGYIAMRDFAEQRALERLSMYERRFEASLFRTMAEFQKLRQARKARQAETVETKAVSYRGRDARETQGRDALATEARRDSAEKQSQSAAADQDLSSFEKREYELLLGTASTRNKANDSHQKTEVGGQRTGVRGQKTENRLRREALVCRY